MGQSQCLQRLHVEFYRVAGVGFQDHLELGMLLEAVGIFAEAPIIGADGGFNIADVPWFGTQHPQEGGGIPRPRSDLGVVWLSD